MATDDLETRWLRFLNDVLGESPNVKRDEIGRAHV